ncbi:MAG TPA: CRISPR-associated ring nuclease Csm6 [Azospirillaceae bacterium]|nr:CRISPR-associated ring nuclease Csm6 [Azospirillaceae bacterium]HRQ81640.1 CRISPR-associated ring nuclease Csm6 [Azospirillaceae bacterium]
MTERRILFCTVGATPQVVTETAWALLKRDPPWVPTEVHVATTTFALDRCREALQSPAGKLAGVFGGGSFPLVILHVPRRGGGDALTLRPDTERRPDTDGSLLQDVNNGEDAAHMGDLILRLMAGFARDDGSAVHVSLAGGRKTMSAHALLAMTLVGRPQDEASHVLVSPQDFEDHRDFWHPDQGGLIADKRNQNQIDPRNAVVSLVTTPTPLMRYEAKKADRLEALRLADVVSDINAAAQFRLAPSLTLDPTRNTVAAGGRVVELSPKHFAIYRLYAAALKNGWRGVGDTDDCRLSNSAVANGVTPSGMLIRDVLTEYFGEAGDVRGRFEDHVSWKRDVLNKNNDADRTDGVKDKIGSNTKLNEELIKQFGITLGSLLKIHGDRKNFGINPNFIPPEAIKIVGDD